MILSQKPQEEKPMASNTKQALLQALSAAEGGYISGQRLA